MRVGLRGAVRGPCTFVRVCRLTRRIECADAWIAATALLYSVPLVTPNRNDYLGVPDLTLISHA